MKFQFNPFTGNFDVGVDDPLTLGGLTVTGIAALQHVHGNIAGTVYVHVKNTSGVELQKGTPVRAVGAVGDTATLEVAAADSSNPLTMPAVAILNETLPANGTGHAAIGGELTGLATGSYGIGQALYVAAGGGLTSTRPTSGTIQQVAIVGRAHASTGSATVTIGALLNPNWDASTGDVTLAASVADVLSMSGQELQADDPGADRILFWDDSAGKLTHLTVGTNLTITGTTINAGGLTKFTEAESTSAPNATVYVDSFTAAATSTNADVALVAKGSGATLAQVPDGTTAGGNKRGAYATDWQKNRQYSSYVASGQYSTIGGGYRNLSSSYSTTVAGGDGNEATNSNSTIGGGSFNTASGQYAYVGGGSSNTASSNYSFVGGGESNAALSNTHATVCGGNGNTASGQYSFVGGGRRGTTRSITGYHVFPACSAPIANTAGVTQSAILLLGRETTGDTATVLTSDSSAASTTNQVILPNNSAYYFRGSVIANVTAGGDTKAWTFEGAIKRGVTAATTAIVDTVVLNVIAQDAGAAAWTVAVTADTTNGGIAVTVTGAASTTIRWVAKLETTEVTY